MSLAGILEMAPLPIGLITIFFIFVLMLPPFSVIRIMVWFQACFFNTIRKTMS